MDSHGTRCSAARRRAALARAVVGAALCAGALASLLPGEAGAKPPRYPVHMEAVGSATSSSQQVVITGAFADAGSLTVSGPTDTVTLSKGTIVLDLSAGAKAENALFTHLTAITNPKTCGVNGSYRAAVKIVSGTGAYEGITGSLSVTTLETGVFPKAANGSCDLSSSATPIGFLSLASGSGTTSLRQS